MCPKLSIFRIGLTWVCWTSSLFRILDPFPELGAELLFFLFDNFDYQVVICVRNSIFIYINILVFLLLCFY